MSRLAEAEEKGVIRKSYDQLASFSMLKEKLGEMMAAAKTYEHVEATESFLKKQVKLVPSSIVVPSKSLLVA